MVEQFPAPQLIAAILPCYTSEGDCSVILTTEGERITTGVRIRTIIRRLASDQAIDLSSLRKIITDATHQSNLQPIPITPRLVLLPVKTRKPRVAGDISTGYINIHAITSMNSINKNLSSGTLINLSGGAKVSTIWTITTVKRHMLLARLATAQAPTTTPKGFRRNAVFDADDDLSPIAHKLAEVIQELLRMTVS
ncbi:hypothetical protein SOV_08180 [Sporomusa ovata DSM 2662]|uniref:Uncharacterized protein n=1 Tax=Sporomusa ovata TaxID=2378 RepID=A0A0U1L686_9FIRM|nr:hypothetical protein [Sporomusa ovata]EQB28470.1 hypothetical protein SOV_1c01560 [Sporomusa ovata DSM 2662]CQR74789.1 hypothetical protein SpAn4DRAFT_4146 [Sporomusa ovata]